MGRRRSKHFHLPPGMHQKGGRFYYGRNDIPLGADLAAALTTWATLRGEEHVGGDTFADAAREYRIHELPKKALKTRREYDRQLNVLCRATWFGPMRLADIRPAHVHKMLRTCKPIEGTRLKALFSAVFNYARGPGDMTAAPNPAAGIRGTKSKRDVYIEDASLAAVLAAADELDDRPLRDFLELAYRSAADPSVVLRMTRQDVNSEALRAARSKTGRVAEVERIGPLDVVLRRLLALSFPVQAMTLILDERGQSMTLATMRRRFWKARKRAGVTWWIRDLRAKAGTDADTIGEARRLLAHASEATTAIYRRRRDGERARPPMREIAEERGELRKRPK